MRREERVTVQGPVKEQQPDGMSHRGRKCVDGCAEVSVPCNLQPFPPTHALPFLNGPRRLLSQSLCWLPHCLLLLPLWLGLDQVFSGEWTLGAVNMLKNMAAHYAGAQAQALRAEAAHM